MNMHVRSGDSSEINKLMISTRLIYKVCFQSFFAPQRMFSSSASALSNFTFDSTQSLFALLPPIVPEASQLLNGIRA